jgi:hypothetical protein
MPYKFDYEAKKIPQAYDRRVKLSDKQREEIVEKYSTGDYTYQQLANMYVVSKSLISFIIHPETLVHNKSIQKPNREYDSVKGSKQMASHRAYKKMLDKKGLLIEQTKNSEN